MVEITRSSSNLFRVRRIVKGGSSAPSPRREGHAEAHTVEFLRVCIAIGVRCTPRQPVIFRTHVRPSRGLVPLTLHSDKMPGCPPSRAAEHRGVVVVRL